MIKCTHANGNPLYIEVSCIAAVMTDREGRTRVYTKEGDDSYWVVKESAEEVVKKIEGPTMAEIFDKMIGGGDCGEPEPPVSF